MHIMNTYSLSMKVAERGQVTIPKKIRDEHGFRPGVEIDFVVEEGRVFLKKKASAEASEGWDKWVAHCAPSRSEAAEDSVGAFIEDIRGR